MSNKLQELTDKLYTEGLTKGKEEGARILEEARQQAEETVANAKAEAATIIAKAEKDAEDLKAKVDSDLKMASAQCLQATKKDIENVLVSSISTDAVKSALADPGFLKKIISAVAEKFSASEATDLALVLPEKLKAELEPWVKGELAKSLGKGVSASFSKKVAGGFTVGPKDGSYFVSLTDETFRELIAEYLRPVTRKLLFG
jgi:V/A-type H+-transporting ATPase subunit E